MAALRFCAPPYPEPRGKRAHLVCRFLHSSPGLRHRLRPAHHSCGRHLHSQSSRGHVSQAGAARGAGDRQLCGRRRGDGGESCHHSAGGGDQRRGGDALHQLVEHEQRQLRDRHHLPDRLQPRHRGRGRAEPRGQRGRPPARRGGFHRHQRPEIQLTTSFSALDSIRATGATQTNTSPTTSTFM